VMERWATPSRVASITNNVTLHGRFDVRVAGDFGPSSPCGVFHYGECSSIERSRQF